MSLVGALVMPLMISGIVLYGLFKKVDVFDCFLEGSKVGIKTAIDILPALLGLVMAVTMMRSSGALDVLVSLLTPVANFLHIPKEVTPLTILCPISGSGALSMYESILKEYGTDNMIERTASIMMGSTETTFYAVTVYYGAVGISKTRYTIPAALSADFTSFVMSALAVRLLF